MGGLVAGHLRDIIARKLSTWLQHAPLEHLAQQLNSVSGLAEGDSWCHAVVYHRVHSVALCALKPEDLRRYVQIIVEFEERGLHMYDADIEETLLAELFACARGWPMD